MNDKATRRATLMGFIAAMICYGLIWLLPGCTSPGSNQSEWHPKTKKEIQMIIGQTTLDAIHQYRRMILHPKAKEVPPLEKSLEKERNRV